jgi:hypothetical protein
MVQMLALPGPRVMDRLSHEMAARRDRQVRLHSVQTDLELDLPPNIPLPDGEEVPYGSSMRLQIRDNEQVRFRLEQNPFWKPVTTQLIKGISTSPSLCESEEQFPCLLKPFTLK